MPAVLRFLISVLLLSSIATVSLCQEDEEEFSEELLLKPLPDRKLLAHFHFENKAPPTRTYGHHHRLFPKAIYQLVISLSLFSFFPVSVVRLATEKMFESYGMPISLYNVGPFYYLAVV